MEAVAHENYKRSAPGRAGILACAIGRANEVTVSELREIARVAYLGQITNIGAVERKNYKRSTPVRVEILARAISYSK